MKIILLICILLCLQSIFVNAQYANPWGEEPAEITKQVMEKYSVEHSALEIREEGFWKFESENSAVLVFETTERAFATLEWGETENYGEIIENAEPHYIHIFYLKNLQPDLTYNVRLSARAYVTDQNITGGNIMVRTIYNQEAVRIPDDFTEGPPYILDMANTYYLLTEDIKADYTAIIFEPDKDGVTLDLGGHRIVYNEVRMDMPVEDSNYQLYNSSFGIKARDAGMNCRILNGTVIQGKGNDESSFYTLGFNPVTVSGGMGFEIAGLSVIYEGTQLTGIFCDWTRENMTFHHNMVEDRGKLIANRHQMPSAIKMRSPGGGLAYNNLIKRARQGGLAGMGNNVRAFNNEIHIESYSVNSFALSVGDSSMVFRNKIFGSGDNVVGIATTGGRKNVEVFDNYIWLHAHNLDSIRPFLNLKELESIDISTMSAVRITWGADDLVYRDNTILTTARDSGIVRGTFLYTDERTNNILVENNLIIALAENEMSGRWGAIGGVGKWDSDPDPMVFKGNTIVSNFTNYSMKDTYGYSVKYLFIENTFVKVGSRNDYVTIKSNEGYRSTGHVFLDSEFEGGAGYFVISMSDWSSDDFTVKWTLKINAPEGTQIRIIDKNEVEVFGGMVGAENELSAILTQFYRLKQEATEYSPHRILAIVANDIIDTTIFMDSKKEIDLNSTTKVENANASESAGILGIFVDNNNSTIKIIYKISKYSQNAVVELFDISGNIIKRIDCNKAPGIYYSINNSLTMPPGFYFIRFTDGKVISTEKFILSK